MSRQRVVASTALAAVLALSGCSSHERARPAADMPLTTTAATVSAQASASALPTPETLTDVLYRLSDPEVPGADKIGLIEGVKPADAETIDKFATALKDGGYLPLNLDAAGLTWSDRHPGNVTADVTVTTANPDTGAFSFPMEFTPHDGAWQLSNETAKTLLAFGKAHTGSTTSAPATP